MRLQYLEFIEFDLSSSVEVEVDLSTRGAQH